MSAPVAKRRHRLCSEFTAGSPMTRMYRTSATLGLLSSLPSSEVVSSEEFHTSHRHHPELSVELGLGTALGHLPIGTATRCPKSTTVKTNDLRALRHRPGQWDNWDTRLGPARRRRGEPNARAGLRTPAPVCAAPPSWGPASANLHKSRH
jgi:hypothetical protein